MVVVLFLELMVKRMGEKFLPVDVLFDVGVYATCGFENGELV